MDNNWCFDDVQMRLNNANRNNIRIITTDEMILSDQSITVAVVSYLIWT